MGPKIFWACLSFWEGRSKKLYVHLAERFEGP